MKRVCVLFGILSVFCVLFLCVSVSALVEVNNFTLNEKYFEGETIKGEINISVSDETTDLEITSNLDGNVLLGDFIGSGFLKSDFCVPKDCSDDYDPSPGTSSKTIEINTRGSYYLGFVIDTADSSEVSITGLDFDISSDFGTKTKTPLSIVFFEDDLWEFNEFSNEYGEKKFGGQYTVSGGSFNYNLINYRYCEKINIEKTDSLILGARVEGIDTEPLDMVLYVDGDEEFCSAVPVGGEIACGVNLADAIEGEYAVCVEADGATNYTIYSQDNSNSSGWAQVIDDDFSVKSFTRDYGIYVRTAKYADASGLSIDLDDFDNFQEAADDFILSKYDRDCLEGCVLPLEISGVDQNFTISNIEVLYSADGGQKEEEVSVLDLVPAEVNFEGVLDLEALGFKADADDEEFKLYFDGVKKIDEDLDVLLGLVINSISPINPPANVPITFYLGAEIGNYSGVKYNWDFGDGKKEQTTTPSVIHTYDDIKKYVLEVEVSLGSGNMTGYKRFNITTVSPEKAVNLTLNESRINIDKVKREINVFPAWYQNVLKKIVNIDFYDSELNRLEKLNENANDEEDFIKIAKELYAIDFPYSVYVSEQATRMPLITDLNDINPLPVQTIAGGVSASEASDLSGYKNPILQWQTENIEGLFSYKEISLLKRSGQMQEILALYSANVKSNSGDESYFVIGKDTDDLYFEKDAGVRDADGFGVIIFDKEALKDFSFYYECSSSGCGELVFFMSPKLSLLPLEASIGKCNFNKVCERSEGEDYGNCRSDCKPIFRMILYIILSIIFVLILWTILQVWYKTKYERHLFKDRRHLFNIIMFINNAHARGISDDEIKKQLRGRKWSKEQITYALKKSRGERTGMYEIIPLDKLIAWRRRKRVAKNPVPLRPPTNVGVGFRRNFATGNQQQFEQKT